MHFSDTDEQQRQGKKARQRNKQSVSSSLLALLLLFYASFFQLDNETIIALSRFLAAVERLQKWQ